jgi:hypothetical protein
VLKRVCVLLLGVAACGLGCENENVAACQAYVEAFGNKACFDGVDPGVDCNAFADYPCAVPDYFDCLADTQQCGLADGSNPEDPYVCTDATEPRCAGETLAGCPDYLDCSG